MAFRPEGGLVAVSQTFSLTIPNGSSNSSWVQLTQRGATSRMALEIASGGPSATITVRHRPAGDTGTGSLVKAAGDIGANLEVTSTTAGGTIGAAHLAPLAALIGQEIRFDISSTPSADLVINLIVF